MAEESTKPRLGRGLAALIGEVGDEMQVLDRARGQRRVPIEFLRPNPRNPRKSFSDVELEELSNSIRERGIIQPILVRSVTDVPDAYEIIAGERRWRSAQRAGLHEVPIVIVEVNDKTSLEYAIIENVQRADLNAIEEAAGYQRLMDEFGYSQSDLAQILGRSRSHVANTLRLMNLPASVQERLVQSEITAGHARALLAVDNPEAVARQIVEQGLTVREVERIAQEQQGESGKADAAKPRSSQAKDPNTRAVEKALEDVLGLAVAIRHKDQGGEIKIRYTNLEQLDTLCRRLKDSATAYD
jgi:ParB family chromosome partitioning protein